jgi:hypothetical protein
MATIHPSRMRDGERRGPEYDEYRRPLGDSFLERYEPHTTIYLFKKKYGLSRRAQREARTVNIWPPSPKAPARELYVCFHLLSSLTKYNSCRSSPKHKKSSKKTKRRRSPSPSETSSDEERRRRKERKERKRARQPSPEEINPDDNDIETVIPPPTISQARQPSSGPPLPDNQDSDDDIGPQPMQKVGGKKIDERSYGGALLRGEGSAMAAFLQDGIESRIPRRGEIGLTSDQIAQYEDVGYVMSGSRHRRMNAVRMRKENQVISAEEKRGILKLQRDERERREAILREEFSELVSERLKGSSTSEPRPK